MNQKEVREIKKRLNPEKDSISRIYGCYVNAAKEIVTTLDMSVGLMEQDVYKRQASMRSRGESMIRQPVTPAALQPKPMHIVSACLPQALQR